MIENFVIFIIMIMRNNSHNIIGTYPDMWTTL